MLGFKSLEQKLRDGNGRTAPATVLGIEEGKSLNWKSDTGPASHGSGNTTEVRAALTKDKCRITVRPEGSRNSRRSSRCQTTTSPLPNTRSAPERLSSCCSTQRPPAGRDRRRGGMGKVGGAHQEQGTRGRGGGGRERTGSARHHSAAGQACRPSRPRRSHRTRIRSGEGQAPRGELTNDAAGAKALGKDFPDPFTSRTIPESGETEFFTCLRPIRDRRDGSILEGLDTP